MCLNQSSTMSTPPPSFVMASGEPLEHKTIFSSRLCQGFHPPVVEVSTPIEDHSGYAFFLALLRDEFSDFLCRCYIPREFQCAPQFGTQSGYTHQRLSCGIHNGLGIDVLQAPKDIEPWFFRSPVHMTPDPLLPFRSSYFLLCRQCLPPCPFTSDACRACQPTGWTGTMDRSLAS
jgi:hypothetical protein